MSAAVYVVSSVITVSRSRNTCRVGENVPHGLGDPMRLGKIESMSKLPRNAQFATLSLNENLFVPPAIVPSVTGRPLPTVISPSNNAIDSHLVTAATNNVDSSNRHSRYHGAYERLADLNRPYEPKSPPSTTASTFIPTPSRSPPRVIPAMNAPSRVDPTRLHSPLSPAGGSLKTNQGYLHPNPSTMRTGLSPQGTLASALSPTKDIYSNPNGGQGKRDTTSADSYRGATDAIPPRMHPSGLTTIDVNPRRIEFAEQTKLNKHEIRWGDTGGVSPFTFGMEENYLDPLENLHREESMVKEDQLMRRVFLRWAACHELSPDFEAALVVPSLKFSDYRLENNYTEEFYRKRMRRRVSSMVALGFLLILLQISFGISKGLEGLKYAANKRTSSSTSAPIIANHSLTRNVFDDPFFGPRGRIKHGRSLLSLSCLPGSFSGDSAFLNENTSLYSAACIDEAVVDGTILIAWLGAAFISSLASKMEAINVILQLIRTGLIIFFAQGIWSPCARSQGPADIMINNLIVASANLTAFNCLALSRTRRSCFVSLAWLAGLIEVCIVMVRAEGGTGITIEDAPQLALFFVVFLVVPIVALCTRYRSEVVERELAFHEEMLGHCKMVNSRLNEQLADMETLRDVDIEKALPEGVVPSQIVHVAVMELKIADRNADALNSAIPTFLMEQTNSPREHESFLQRLQTAKLSAKDIPMTFPRKDFDVPHNMRFLRDSSAKTRTAQDACMILDATTDIKARIQSAVKLLSRSHDFYSSVPLNDYQGAFLFHALGHEVYRATTSTHKAYQSSISTSRHSSRKALTRTAELSPTGEVSSTLFTADIPQMQQLPFLSGLGEIARNIGQSWTFDMLKVTRVTKDQSMLTAAMLLVSPIVERISSGFEWQKWYQFIRTIQGEYGPSDKIPYHNRTHAAIHAHTTSVLLNWFRHAEHSTPIESLAVLTASLCHDVGHPGRTNAYLVNANKRLAIVYNDIAVLENLHACKTFETLLMKENNFLWNIDNEDYRFFRKLVIELILATDMKVHIELSNAFKLLRNATDFNIWSDMNNILTLKMIIKAADLSHGAFDWPIHHQLSMAVTEEFWAQGDAEERMGLPKSPLCDRAKSHELAKSQIGFLEYVVLPIYAELAHVDQSGHISGTCEPLIRTNISKWKLMATSQGNYKRDNLTSRILKNTAPALSQTRSNERNPADNSRKIDRKETPIVITEEFSGDQKDEPRITRINFDDE